MKTRKEDLESRLLKAQKKLAVRNNPRKKLALVAQIKRLKLALEAL